MQLVLIPAAMYNVLQESVMAANGKQTCYEGRILQNYQVYLEQSGLHKRILQGVHHILLGEFKR